MSSSLRTPHRLLVLLGLLASVSTPTALAAGVTVEDSGTALARTVADAVRKADLGPSASLRIADAAGTIRLEGWCATLACRENAAFAAESASESVRDLAIHIGLRPTRSIPDSELQPVASAAVQTATAGDAATAAQVSVQAGRATLSGTATTWELKAAARDAVRGVDGILSVEDAISVVPTQGTVVLSPSEPTPPQRVPTSYAFPEDGRTVVLEGQVYDVIATSEGHYLLRPRNP
jgi:osmotically-inducible protein OsmY